MMDVTATDDLIVGGGAAGLSLAGALLQHDNSGRNVHVLESRRRYVRDRTWCFWGNEDSPHGDLITHRWNKWRVRAHGRETVSGSRSFSYCHIPADAFYDKALRQIDRAPNSSLDFETEVTGIKDKGTHVVVATNRGDLTAQRVFDGRPPADVAQLNSRHITLQQHFMGWHVRVEREMFDPTTVTLMDFKSREDSLIQFFYVLPFTREEALVEATFISSRSLVKSDYERELTAYLEGLIDSAKYEVVWSEFGCIPMSTQPPVKKRSDRVFAIGATAGLTKPSTGYAFLAIQKYSHEMAERLACSFNPSPPRIRSSLMSALDRIFLSVLNKEPDLAPSIFFRLFQKVDPDTLVRFLSDDDHIRNVLPVVSAMPKRPFIRQAIASAPLWVRP